MLQNNCACVWCGKEFYRKPRYIYRGRPVFCRNACRTLYERSNRTKEQIEADRISKSKYDKEYRLKNAKRLKVSKAKYFQENYDPVKQRKYNQANMQRHIEYCQRPEYRKKKHEYDQEYRYKKVYGEFWECMMLVRDIHNEVVKQEPDKIERMKMRGNYWRRIERAQLKRGNKYDWLSRWERYKNI